MSPFPAQGDEAAEFRPLNAYETAMDRGEKLKLRG